jgi:hypothetical protein
VNDAREEVHLLLEDQIARLADPHIGFGLVVADHELELAPEQTALGIDLVHRDLMARDAGLCTGGRRRAVDDADLDRVLLADGQRKRAPRRRTGDVLRQSRMAS